VWYWNIYTLLQNPENLENQEIGDNLALSGVSGEKSCKARKCMGHGKLIALLVRYWRGYLSGARCK